MNNNIITVADLVKIATEKPEMVTIIINGEYYDIATA